MMALAMATMPMTEVFQFFSKERKKVFMTVECHCQFPPDGLLRRIAAIDR